MTDIDRFVEDLLRWAVAHGIEPKRVLEVALGEIERLQQLGA